MEQVIIVASIHQPSTTTFQLFDKLLLLSGGSPCYFGPVSNVESYFGQVGCPVPAYTNPAEFILDLVSADFNDDLNQANKIRLAWPRSSEGAAVMAQIESMDVGEKRHALSEDELSSPRPGVLRIIMTLLHRSFIKSYRDVVAYGIRIVMYLGLAIMMGTVWLRLHPSQESIQPFINAIVSPPRVDTHHSC